MNERNQYFDNVKGALILMVVLGHLVWPLPASDRCNQTLYSFLYLFHMPMFAVISGYFSRAEASRRYLARSAARLLGPYAVFQTIQLLICWKYGLQLRPLDGLCGLWYLLSLFCWRLMLPLFARRRGAFLVAILIALSCGYVEWIGLAGSLSRTLVLFPYFLAGFHLSDQCIDVRRLVPRPAAIMFLLLSLAICWQTAGTHAHVLLWDCFSYQTLDLSTAIAPVFRLMRMMIAFSVGFSLMALIPTSRSVLTSIGKHSLTIYLLHSPLLLVYRQHPPLYQLPNSVPLSLLFVGAVVVTVALGHQRTVNVTRFLTRPLQL
jgi:fucose 4-O-acetylase-like acetyltransferase